MLSFLTFTIWSGRLQLWLQVRPLRVVYCLLLPASLRDYWGRFPLKAPGETRIAELWTVLFAHANWGNVRVLIASNLLRLHFSHLSFTARLKGEKPSQHPSREGHTSEQTSRRQPWNEDYDPYLYKTLYFCLYFSLYLMPHVFHINIFLCIH